MARQWATGRSFVASTSVDIASRLSIARWPKSTLRGNRAKAEKGSAFSDCVLLWRRGNKERDLLLFTPMATLFFQTEASKIYRGIRNDVNHWKSARVFIRQGRSRILACCRWRVGRSWHQCLQSGHPHSYCRTSNGTKRRDLLERHPVRNDNTGYCF